MPPFRLLLYFYNAGLLFLVGASVLAHVVVPFGLLAALLTGYVALLALGALVPRLEMYGDILHRVATDEPILSLTFDDGPDPRSTPQVLDALARAGARATFFVIGERARRYPELIARMVTEGHTVGLHSEAHDRLYAFRNPATVTADLERCQEALAAAGISRSPWLRPPVGQTSPRLFAGAKPLALTVVGWSGRARDGLRRTTAGEALERLLRAARPGAILLLHDAWERPAGQDELAPAGVRCLSELLAGLEARGLRSVTLERLLGLEETGARPGAR